MTICFTVKLSLSLAYAKEGDKVKLTCQRFRETSDSEERNLTISVFKMFLERSDQSLNQNITLLSCAQSMGSLAQSGSSMADLRDVGLRSPSLPDQGVCDKLPQTEYKLEYLIYPESLINYRLHCFYQEEPISLKREVRASISLQGLEGMSNS